MRCPQFIQAVLKKKSWLCVFIIVAVWASFYYPSIRHVKDAYGDNDWYQNYFFAENFRKTILEYHQFPFRSIFAAGGYPILGHPYDPSFNLFVVPFILLLGSVVAVNLTGLLLPLLGALGMYVLTRNALKYNWLGVMYAVVIFMLTKWGLNFFAEGNYEKLYFWLFPWLLFCLIKAGDKIKYVVGAVVIAYVYIVQSILIFIPIGIFLLLFTSLKSVVLKDRYRIHFNGVYIKRLWWILVCALLLAAVKILPMIELYQLRTGPIHHPLEDSYKTIAIIASQHEKSMNGQMLKQLFFDRDFFDLAHAVYFGCGPVLIGMAAIIVYFRQLWIWGGLLMVFIFMGMGSNAPVDVFKWVWHIHPAVHAIWRLTKYFSFFIVFLIPLIGGKLFSLCDGTGKGSFWLKSLGMLLIGVCAYHMFLYNRVYYNNGEMTYEPVVEVQPQKKFFQVKIEEFYKEKHGSQEDVRALRPAWDLLRRNIGLVNLSRLVNMPIKESVVAQYVIPTGGVYYKSGNTIGVPLYQGLFEQQDDALFKYGNPFYRGEIFFLNSDNTAVLHALSPNKIIISGNLCVADNLVLNQNYHHDWQSNYGDVINHNGLLAVRLTEKGLFQIELRYMPKSFYNGFCISLLTLISIGIFWVIKRRSMRQKLC